MLKGCVYNDLGLVIVKNNYLNNYFYLKAVVKPRCGNKWYSYLKILQPKFEVLTPFLR